MPPMKNLTRSVLLVCALGAGFIGTAWAERPVVEIVTNHGVIKLEVMDKLAPRTAANFLNLIDNEFYNGLVFHRVIANFMIQGGGYKPSMEYVPGPQTVPNESFNGVKNARGTVAMARLSDPDSADTQFFINVKDNPHLDASPGKPGYTVFARVIDGMGVVETIELVNTHLSNGMAAVPEEPVIIETIRRAG